jgi:hypothetical protein
MLLVQAVISSNDYLQFVQNVVVIFTNQYLFN